MAILSAHREAIAGVDTFYLWHYPPTYLLTVTPLGALPYLAALGLFMGVSLWAWAWVVRRVVTDPRGWWAAAALPGGLFCVIHGQNGFLIAAMFGAALLLLDRRPIISGVLIGLLAIKPHFAVLIPIALIAAGRWRTFAAAAATVVLFVLATILAFGVEAWRAFFDNLPYVRQLVDAGWIPWRLMPTVHVMARSLGLPSNIALAVQACAALGAAFFVWRAWRSKETPFAVKAAALTAGSMLVSPYLFLYDMPLLGLAIGWLAMHGLKHGFMPGEKQLLAIAWAAPLIALPLLSVVHVQIGALATIGVLYCAARRSAPSPVEDYLAPRLRPFIAQLGTLVQRLRALLPPVRSWFEARRAPQGGE